jgi:very-short-patch-repair endonuclease
MRLRRRRTLGLKFRRQHAISRFIVDFYCAELRLVLEIDGGIHGDPERAAYDAARTAWLETHGFRVMRIRNDQLTADGLRNLLRDLTNRPPSPRSGEGDRG